MSIANPLPRSPRRTDYEALPGQTLFGPTPWLAADPLDVAVFVLDDLGIWQPQTSGVTIALTASPIGAVSATFATGRDAGDQVRIEARRIHQRVTDVTRGGALATALLERELDLQAMVLQELRRDTDDTTDTLQTFDADMKLSLANAAASVAAARAWALTPYGVDVPGEPGGRSSRHYAEEAAQQAATAGAYAALAGGIIYDFGAITDGVAGEEDWGMI